MGRAERKPAGQRREKMSAAPRRDSKKEKETLNGMEQCIRLYEEWRGRGGSGSKTSRMERCVGVECEGCKSVEGGAQSG